MLYFGGAVQKRVLDDIYKRLDSFMLQWKDGKLSKPVKASMTNLVDGNDIVSRAAYYLCMVYM